MGFRDILNTNATTAGGKLTLEDMLKLHDDVRRQPPRPPHRHLIAASATPGTWTRCSDCAAPVRVPDDWS
jgi:hypothetical protein